MSRLPKNRWSRLLLTIVVLLIVIILIGNYIAAGIIENVVQNQFVKLNAKETQVWSIEDIDVDMFTGTLKIKHIQIEHDSTYFQKFLEGDTPNANLIGLGVRNVLLKGINVYDIFVRNYLNLKEIRVEGMTVTVHKRPSDRNQPTDTLVRNDSISSSKTLIVPGLKKIDLNDINVEQLTFIVVDAIENKPLETYHGEKMEIAGLSLDPAGVLEGLFQINRENLSIHLENQHITLSEANYAMSFDAMDLYVRKGELSFTRLQIKPTTDKYKMASSFAQKKEVFEVELPRLQLTGIRIDEALHNGRILLDSVVIDSFRIAINTDVGRPRNLNRIPDFPNQLLRKAGLPLQVGEIHLKDGSLQYQEFNSASPTVDITLTNLNISVENIRTGPADNIADGSLQVGVQGTFLQDADFQIKLDFPYADPSYGFRYTGHVGSFKMTHLNPLLASTNIAIADGRANNISYNVHCNTHQCAGDFTMAYNDLKIDIEKNRIEKKNKKLSLLANTLIKSNNPHNGRLKSVNVQAERVTDRGLVHLLIGTLKSGAKQTLTP